MADENVTNLTTDVDIKGTIKFDKVMKIEGKFEGELILHYLLPVIYNRTIYFKHNR